MIYVSSNSLGGCWWWCWNDLEKDHSVCDVVTRWSCGYSVCDLWVITVFVLVTRWSRWYIAWPVIQVWDGSCGTWALRWWLISILVVHIVVISCFIMVVVNLINLLNAMLLSCLDVFGCCELASTFNVLTWCVMPDCRWCRDCLIACTGFRSCELDRVLARVPAEWSSLPS